MSSSAAAEVRPALLACVSGFALTGGGVTAEKARLSIQALSALTAPPPPLRLQPQRTPGEGTGEFRGVTQLRFGSATHLPDLVAGSGTQSFLRRRAHPQRGSRGIAYSSSLYTVPVTTEIKYRSALCYKA